jgi:formate dehydrogenase subunit gamma
MDRHATEAAGRLRRRRRSMGWTLAAVLVLAVSLPFAGHLLVSGPEAQAQAPVAEQQANPRSDMWRQARQSQRGTTTVTGPYVTSELITNVGQNWRQFRMGPLVTYGSYLLIGVLAAIALFFLVRGRIRLEHGRSGMTVPRWTAGERAAHWFTASTFIILAITGLSLLFGRSVLIPLLGPQAFAAYAQVAMNVHNYVGPAFAIGVLTLIVMWMRHNIFNRTDWRWFKEGGGIVGRGHPSAGKLNGGEKVWFWLGLFVLGLAVIISGLVLNFPLFGQTREMMAGAHVVHAIASLFWIAFAFGHIYIGTLGTEGALEGMARGRVDVNWAKQHHDLWYDEITAAGVRPQPADQPTEPAVPPREARVGGG